MKKIISLEGNIGAGKTTFLKHLEESLQTNTEWVFLKEPVPSKWIFLQEAAELPISLVPSASGIRFDAKSAVITNVSLAESPMVVVPPATVIVPSIVAFPANSNLPKDPVDAADDETLPAAVILFHL